MNELPSVDDLLGKGSFWDGDKAKAPNGQSFWRFMIFKYPNKHTYERTTGRHEKATVGS